MAQSSNRKSPARKTATTKSRPAAAQQPKRGQSGPTPVLEWVAAGLGLIVLVGTIGFIAAEAFQPDRSPPQVVVERLGVRQIEAGYLVTVRAVNRGGSPAAQVVVEGELMTGGEPQTAEATFDFIADHSSREGGLFFESDPRQGALTLRAKGYATP